MYFCLFVCFVGGGMLFPCWYFYFIYLSEYYICRLPEQAAFASLSRQQICKDPVMGVASTVLKNTLWNRFSMVDGSKNWVHKHSIVNEKNVLLFNLIHGSLIPLLFSCLNSLVDFGFSLFFFFLTNKLSHAFWPGSLPLIADGLLT